MQGQDLVIGEEVGIHLIGEGERPLFRSEERPLFKRHGWPLLRVARRIARAVYIWHDDQRKLQTFRLMNCQKRNTARRCVFRNVFIFINTAIFQKPEKLIEKLVDLIIKVFRLKNDDIMQILKFAEKF